MRYEMCSLYEQLCAKIGIMKQGGLLTVNALVMAS